MELQNISFEYWSGVARLPVPMNLSSFLCHRLKLRSECTCEPIGQVLPLRQFSSDITPKKPKIFTNNYISQVLKNVWSQFDTFSVQSRVLEGHSHVFAHAQDFWFLDKLSRIQRCENW